MAKIIFLGMPAYGHINPTLPVVKELVNRGEHVIYYALNEFRAAIEETGATFRNYRGNLPAEMTIPNEASLRIFQQRLITGEKILEHRLQEIADEQADIIIYDQLAIWGRCIAQILQVPTICSIVTFVPVPRLLLSDPGRIWERMISPKARLQVYAITRRISKRYHIKRLRLRDISSNAGDLNIIYTSRYFQPYADTFDDTYKFVGPSMLPRISAPAFPFASLQPEKPLIYISLGTIYNQQPRFYRMCIEALRDSPYQAVLSVGQQTNIASLGTLPTNVIVQPSVPQLEILQRTALFITHGGMNSTSEALYHSVSLIVIPQDADQPWVARRVEELGAGQKLHPKAITALLLRRKIDEVLNNPAIAQASAQLGKSLRATGGYQQAADEILQFMSKHKKSSL